MKEFKCSVAQKGFFAGPVFCFFPVSQSENNLITDTESEIEKLQHAENLFVNTIRQNNISGNNAEICETVLSILNDDVFRGRIENNIRSFQLNAPAAVMKAAQEFSEALGSVDSEYIRSRKDDILGVANQLISVLCGINGSPAKCSAICAPEISPAQLGSIDERFLGGLLTDKGSPNSHASIIASNISIPYLYGNSDAVNEARNAGFIILDGETGTVITDPDEEMRANALRRMKQAGYKKTASEKFKEELPPQSKIKIYANIEGPRDIDELLKSDADGVGLFRTEFLFLNRDTLPTEEEQYAAYSSVLEAMGDKEVIIRTMDIGSDKKPRWLELPDEFNPALGLRGVRVSLEKKELFKIQLRALLRAGVKGNLKIMFPMIASPWEIDEAKERVRDAAEELSMQGIEYKIPPIGIMVETPAAALCAEELAEKADFFSIGTNDLTQYTIALDREAQGLDRYFMPHHESVFRLIGMTADGGHKHGIETGVCGQLAADSEAVSRLIELGVDELSVAVRKVRDIRIQASEAEKQMEEKKRLENQNRFSMVFAPADGLLIPMPDIPDPVFADGTMGECFGILPSNGSVYSPVNGTVIAIAETGHAMTIKADTGMNILLHVGINTVSLKSKAFIHHVKIGEQVKKGQHIMEADLEMIKNEGLSPIIVVIALNK
ncbi:MAG: phosphoenolpyruvate--protein phosphotransferase [Eubacteriales bacterium]|nr:phosphoenolpyruvate--protein phosphotransferase [Eubacteriales bacterium]